MFPFENEFFILEKSPTSVLDTLIFEKIKFAHNTSTEVACTAYAQRIHDARKKHPDTHKYVELWYNNV